MLPQSIIFTYRSIITQKVRMRIFTKRACETHVRTFIHFGTVVLRNKLSVQITILRILPTRIRLQHIFQTKNIAGRISRVLYSLRSLYHLSRPEVTLTTHQQPTPRHRTSHPSLSVYMVLQPVRRTAGTCHHARGGLLPHLFTLTGAKASAVILCYAAIPSRRSSR